MVASLNESVRTVGRKWVAQTFRNEGLGRIRQIRGTLRREISQSRAKRP